MQALSKIESATANDHGLTRVLQTRRDEIASAIASAFDLSSRWKIQADAQRDSRDDYLATNFRAFADYLIEFFDRGDAVFKHLFVGELIKALYEPALDDEAAGALTKAILADMRLRLETALRPALTAHGWALFDELIGSCERLLTAATVKTERVLMVGDCLFLDIVPFIVSELLDAGIRFVPDYATSKNPAALRDELRALSTKRFDLVFFSPFSYEFSPDYARLAEWRRALTNDAAIQQVVQTTWAESSKTIDLLADLFDCPIHIHNSAAIVREESAAKRLVKVKATARARATARQAMNGLLEQHVAQRNAASFQHMFVFDEHAMVQAAGELEAGAFFYRTALQHPVVMGRVLAQGYIDLIYANAWLAKKKVVVCDLDNTLWEGVIGEGEVAHFHDRQKTLAALKAKGVVLAVNSKNDPANVHWRGGTLVSDDFVYQAISWDPKVQGMKRIQAALNLKMKDYVFVDDREDELALMRMTYPEILCLDATDAATWRRFGVWARGLENDSEMDRTLMYRQREERKAFVQDEVSSQAEREELFSTLQLKLTIREAQTADLKRVAELINRTNQFNLEGSRTSFKEVTAWHESAEHLILLGQTADRFGDMGTTCIAVVQIDGRQMRLLPFVLSCRVFGYGIERGVMNHLREIAMQRGVTQIVGRYVATPQNTPCQSFLPDNGFVETNELWSLATEAPAAPAPPWLTIAAR